MSFEIVKTDKYFLNGGDFFINQLIKHNKSFSHIQYEKNERRRQYIFLQIRREKERIGAGCPGCRLQGGFCTNHLNIR